MTLTVLIVASNYITRRFMILTFLTATRAVCSNSLRRPYLISRPAFMVRGLLHGSQFPKALCGLQVDKAPASLLSACNTCSSWRLIDPEHEVVQRHERQQLDGTKAPALL